MHMNEVSKNIDLIQFSHLWVRRLMPRFWLVLESEKPKPSDLLFNSFPHKLTTAVKHSFDNLVKIMNHFSLKSQWRKSIKFCLQLQ